MGPTEKPRTGSLRGIIVPTEWGPAGEARCVAILTQGEAEYEVAPRKAGYLLLENLRQEVKARVIFHGSPDARQVVTVLSFVRVETPDSDHEAVGCGPAVLDQNAL